MDPAPSGSSRLAIVVGMAGEVGVGDPSDRRMRPEELDHLGGYPLVAFHPGGEGLYALKHQPGDHGVHAGPEVAQPLGPGAHGERSRAELLGEHDPVWLIVLGERGEPPGPLPVEGSSVDQQPCDDRPMTSEPLVAEWTTRSAPCSTGRHRAGVAKVLSTRSGTPWRCAMSAIADRSATSSPGLPMVSTMSKRVSGRKAASTAARSQGMDQGGLDPEAGKRVIQEVDRASVERRRGHDVTALAHERGDGKVAACPDAVATATAPSRATIGLRAPQPWGWTCGCRCWPARARSNKPRRARCRRRRMGVVRWMGTDLAPVADPAMRRGMDGQRVEACRPRFDHLPRIGRA